MTARTSIRATALAVLIVGSWLVPDTTSVAGDMTVNEPPTQTIRVAASDVGSHAVALGVSKSVVIDLPRDIKDVLVADPKIANAVVRSSRRAYIIGIEMGQTNVFFFDAEGRQMAGFDIAVTRNLNGIRAAIRQVIPDADITVEGIGDGVILAGTAANQAEAQQAYDIATRLLGAGSSETVGAGLQDRQRHRGARARSDHAEGDRRRGRARYHQAARHQSVRHPRLRHGRAQFQQYQSVLGLRPAAHQLEHHGRLEKHQRHVERHGTGRRPSHSCRTEPHRDFRRDRDVRGRRRIPDPGRLDLRHHEVAAGLPALDRIQEIRRQSQLHAGRARPRAASASR